MLKIPFWIRKIAIKITTILGITMIVELAVMIISEEIISKKLVMLNPVMKTTPFANKNKPKIKTKLLGII